MKKLILFAALLVPTIATADPSEHREHDRGERHHREYHGGGNRFGWGELVGGMILGGIIAHEIDGRYYDNDRREVRRVTICNDYPIVDQYGRYVFDPYGRMITERRCHDEWVYVN